MATEYFQSRPQFWPRALYNGAEMTGNRKLTTDSGLQVTFNHDYLHLGKGDQGGPWLLEKDVYTYVFGHFQNKNPSLGYNGPTLPWDDNSFDIPALGARRSDASYYFEGASAIAATEPTNAIWNGSTFIGETASDGLALVPGVRGWEEITSNARRAQRAGQDYLQYQFDWLPFVSDMRNFAYAVKNSHDILHNYREHSGRKIRRRLNMTDTLSQQTESSLKFLRTFGSKSIGSALTYYTASLRERTWFSGAFRFYVPVDDSAASRWKRYRAYAHKLLGADLTPEVVWNIAPWSWAVDWKTDVGSVIHNWSSIGHNGLVLQYGYMMHEQQATWTADAGPFGLKSHSLIRKRRVAANPYGFGVSASSLNQTQISILVALGLTRGDARVAWN